MHKEIFAPRLVQCVSTLPPQPCRWLCHHCHCQPATKRTTAPLPRHSRQQARAHRVTTATTFAARVLLRVCCCAAARLLSGACAAWRHVCYWRVHSLDTCRTEHACCVCPPALSRWCAPRSRMRRLLQSSRTVPCTSCLAHSAHARSRRAQVAMNGATARCPAQCHDQTATSVRTQRVWALAVPSWVVHDSVPATALHAAERATLLIDMRPTRHGEVPTLLPIRP